MIRCRYGRTVRLTVVRRTPFGWFLADGEDDALLHKNETDKEWNEEEEAEVFLYSDSQGRIASTTFIPVIQVGKYGWGEVTKSDEATGVFVDIGIKKDMLLGKEDLPVKKTVWPKPGDVYNAESKPKRQDLCEIGIG